MNIIYTFRIINIFSLVFMVFDLFLNLVEYKGINIFLYIWICTLTIILSILKEKKEKSGIEFLCLLGAFPAFLTMDNILRIYIFLITLVSFYIIHKNLFIIDYQGAKLQNKRAFYFIIIFTFLCMSPPCARTFKSVSIIYIIIFLLSYVLLLRTLRSFKYTGNTQSKFNIFIVGIIAGLSLLLSSNLIRSSFIVFWKRLYGGLIDLIFDILGFILKPIAGIIEDFIERLREFIENLYMSRGASGNTDIKVNQQPFKVNPNKKSLVEIVFSNNIIKTILILAIIILILYIIHKIFMKNIVKKINNEEYIEQREFILKENKDKVLNRMLSRFKIRDTNEKIRYYYTKLLKLYINKGILIQDSDTTKDIDIKASKYFEFKKLNNIRNIYLMVRYGNIKASKEIVREFERECKKIKV